MTRGIGFRQTVIESFELAKASLGPSFLLAGPVALAGFGLLLLPLGVPVLYAPALYGYLALLMLTTLAAAIVPQAMASGVAAPSHAIKLVTVRAFWVYLGSSFACFLIPLLAAAVPASFAISDPSLLVGGDPEALAWLALSIAIWTWLTLRLSLVLPAIAAGEPFSLRRSWRLTRGNTAAIGVCLLLAVVPVSLLQHAMVETVVASAEDSTTVAAIGVALGLAMTIVQAVAYGTVTGVAFKRAAGGIQVGAS